MAAIKNVSRNAIDAIVRARGEGGPFRSLDDFARRAYGTVDAGVLTRTALECLIKAGSFDPLGQRRAAMLAGVDSVLATAARLRRDRSMGQVSLFGGAGTDGAEGDGTETSGEEIGTDS